MSKKTSEDTLRNPISIRFRCDQELVDLLQLAHELSSLSIVQILRIGGRKYAEELVGEYSVRSRAKTIKDAV